MTQNYLENPRPQVRAMAIPHFQDRHQNPSARRASAASTHARWAAEAATWACAGLGGLFLGVKACGWVSGAALAMIFSTMAFGQEASLPVVATPDVEIVRLAETYRHAVLNADATAATAVFRDDAVEMPPFQPPIVGREAIARSYENAFHGPVKVTAFTFTHAEATIHGDVAFDIGTYKRTMSGTPQGTIEVAGPYVVILKRTNGTWKIAYIIYNYAVPPAPPGSAATR
jgi:uncharacterized protein (TIGR02246 family)